MVNENMLNVQGLQFLCPEDDIMHYSAQVIALILLFHVIHDVAVMQS